MAGERPVGHYYLPSPPQRAGGVEGTSPRQSVSGARSLPAAGESLPLISDTRIDNELIEALTELPQWHSQRLTNLTILIE